MLNSDPNSRNYPDLKKSQFFASGYHLPCVGDAADGCACVCIAIRAWHGKQEKDSEMDHVATSYHIQLHECTRLLITLQMLTVAMQISPRDSAESSAVGCRSSTRNASGVPAMCVVSGSKHPVAV